MSLVWATPGCLFWSIEARGNDLPVRQGMSIPPAGSPAPQDQRTVADVALVRRMADGDKAALGDLYDRLARPLLATATTVLGDQTEAQDVVHDVFVVLWEKAAWYESERGSPFSWAVTLVRNRAIDRLRSRRRRAALLENAAPDDLGYESRLGAAAAGDTAEAGDQARVVRSAVSALPPDQKTALEMAFFGGLTQQEIASRLKEPLGTIKARIRRALLRLRDTLPQRP